MLFFIVDRETSVTPVPIYYSLLSIEGPQSDTYPYAILYCRWRDLSHTYPYTILYCQWRNLSHRTYPYTILYCRWRDLSHTHTHILLVFFLVDEGSDEASLWNTFVIFFWHHRSTHVSYKLHVTNEHIVWPWPHLHIFISLFFVYAEIVKDLTIETQARRRLVQIHVKSHINTC